MRILITCKGDTAKEAIAPIRNLLNKMVRLEVGGSEGEGLCVNIEATPAHEMGFWDVIIHCDDD